ncbi:hypothetical protein E4T56_gene15548 [Termitomyces sp. T112]|nr:hypothetical protein E4T56_gene15548 [Termitomyces sp. T112]KAH0583102.1 hypothetical protein H2248_010988 [Termitomyces sp. 'cryptogamus']KNZ78819.1 hypothetical protein J132_09746 [Termitomyces sp. J132]
MFHENIRVARHHRGLVARAVTIASELPPAPTTTTTAGEEKGKEKQKQEDDPPTDRPATDARPGPATVHKSDDPRPDDPISTPISATTLSIVQPVVPTAPDTVVAGPVLTTTSVFPVITTSSVAFSSTFSSKSASVKVSTLTTAVKPSSTSHAATSAKASASSTPVATGAVSGGAIAGGVVGGLAGLALLAAVVFVVVRHYRRKSLDTLVFNASKFRHSALLLNDPPTPKEKMPEQRGPRPPSMISRHLNAPAVPQVSAASPYSEHAAQSADPYGHYATAAAQYSVGMYGADGQIVHDPYADVYGANAASDRYVSHGQAAFGAPPMQFQFPQRPYQQQQGYRSSFAPDAYPSTAVVNAPLPNPISSAPPSTSASTSRAAAQVKSASPDSSHSHSTSGSHSKHEVLIRRPSQPNNDPYENDPKYANIQRNVKVAPDTLAAVNNASLFSASGYPAASTVAHTSVAPTTSNARRPMSSYTVYNPEDAYGGM